MHFFRRREERFPAYVVKNSYRRCRQRVTTEGNEMKGLSDLKQILRWLNTLCKRSMT